MIKNNNSSGQEFLVGAIGSILLFGLFFAYISFSYNSEISTTEIKERLRKEAKVEKNCTEKSKITDIFVEEKFLSDKDYFLKLENGQISNTSKTQNKIGDELCMKEITKVTFFGEPNKIEQEIKKTGLLVSSYVDEIKTIENGNLVLTDSYSPAIEGFDGHSYKLHAKFSKIQN